MPCYDEVASIGKLIERLEPVVEELSQDRPVQVTCIDDGSRDGTGPALAEAARRHRWLAIVRHEENLGLGAAIRTGVRASGHDLIAMLDADGTYDPSDLPRLIAELESGYDVVIGSPYHPAGRAEGVGAVRLWLSRSLSRAYRSLSRSDVHCFSGIFKVYRREVLAAVEFEGDGFAAVSEILLGALARGFRVAEVPATLTQRAAGHSKMHIWPELRAHARLLWRLRRGLRSPPGASSAPAPTRTPSR